MKPRVLVLCTGNSCRSQIAEGWLRAKLGDRVDVASAGIRPAPRVHPLAIAVMREEGIDISLQRPRSVADAAGPFDVVVTVCDDAREACPVFPGAARTLHFSFPDPALADGTEAERLAVFRTVRDAIGDYLVPLVAAHLPAHAVDSRT